MDAFDKIFAQNLRGTGKVDLFPSRICHQHLHYMTWIPDLNTIATNSIRHDQNKSLNYAFPHIV